MSTVNIERDGDVAIITLADPPLNLISPAMLADFETAVLQAHNMDVRAMLIRAEGDNFSAGANVEAMFKGRLPRSAHALISRAGRAMVHVEQLPFPTICAVQGMCLAGGLEIALACDMIWAAEDAQLGQIEAVIGAMPFGGGVQRLVSCCGPYRAREIVYGGRLYDPKDFERWNIVNRVVPAADLQAKAMKYTHQLAAGPTLAHAITKRVVRTAIDSGLRAADLSIPELSAPLFDSSDLVSGIASLLKNGPGKATFEGK